MGTTGKPEGQQQRATRGIPHCEWSTSLQVDGTGVTDQLYLVWWVLGCRLVRICIVSATIVIVFFFFSGTVLVLLRGKWL